MNLLQRNLLAAVLLSAFAVPSVAADTPPASPAPASPPAAEQSKATAPDLEDSMRLMQAVHARRLEMMQTEDPEKLKELMRAQTKDMEALIQIGPPGPGMGMGMMMGAGKGHGPMAMGAGGCKTGPGPHMGKPGGPHGIAKVQDGDAPCAMGGHCKQHHGAVEHRLDALEKRMDMLQSMLEYLMRR